MHCMKQNTLSERENERDLYILYLRKRGGNIWKFKTWGYDKAWLNGQLANKDHEIELVKEWHFKKLPIKNYTTLIKSFMPNNWRGS